MDPLSDVLSLLRPRRYMSSGFDAGGDWSVQVAKFHGAIKCYAVVRGRCWLSVDGVFEPVELESGDCFILPSGRPFRLASDLSLTSTDADTVFAGAGNGGRASMNGGEDFSLIGSRFDLAGQAEFLLGVLPPIVHIREDASRTALRGSVEQMMEELRDPQLGGLLVIEHLAHIMLVRALRVHIEDASKVGVGWLFALTDKQIGAALTVMHQDPAHRWTLQELAERAGLSRSIFAERFKKTVGSSALEYLTRWRMLLAGDRLEQSGDPVSLIAPSLGYESESAFSAAFKRVMGCSPRQYSCNQGLKSQVPLTKPSAAIGFDLLQSSVLQRGSSANLA